MTGASEVTPEGANTSQSASVEREFVSLLDLLGPKEIEMLSQFQRSGSIPATAKALRLNDRTVQRHLEAINKRFVELTDSTDRALIAVHKGRKGFRLTDLGEEFVNGLRAINKDIRNLVASHAQAAGQLNIVVISKCLEMLKDLSKDPILADHKIILMPIYRRSAQTHAESDTDGPCAFYSIAAEERPPFEEAPSSSLTPKLVPTRSTVPPVHEVREPSNGNVETWNHLGARSIPYEKHKVIELRAGHRSLLPIKVEHFKLLAPKKLITRFGLDPDEDEIEVEQVLDDGWTLLAPRSGAVAQFLDRTAPGWYKKKTVRECTGLYTGLQSLRCDLIPRRIAPSGGAWGGQVMIVHGAEDVVPGYEQLQIRQDPARRPFVALTGLFLDRVQLNQVSASDKERWSLTWQRARAIWHL